MRNTPELRFIGDQSIEYGVNMSKLIDDVTANLRGESGEFAEGEEAGESEEE